MMINGPHNWSIIVIIPTMLLFSPLHQRERQIELSPCETFSFEPKRCPKTLRGFVSQIVSVAELQSFCFRRVPAVEKLSISTTLPEEVIFPDLVNEVATDELG